MTKNARLVREHEARKGQLGAKPTGIGMMTRRVAAVAVLILAALALPAAGASETENFFCEIEDPALVACGDVLLAKAVVNPCPNPDDIVTLSGTIHVAVFEDENQSRIHTNWQDVTGVGFPSGAIYQANEATRLYEVQRPSGALTFVLQDERELVTKGSLENFILREYIEMTVKDSDVTFREHGETKCTG